jgi:hypothetical protein
MGAHDNAWPSAPTPAYHGAAVGRHTEPGGPHSWPRCTPRAITPVPNASLRPLIHGCAAVVPSSAETQLRQHCLAGLLAHRAGVVALAHRAGRSQPMRKRRRRCCEGSALRRPEPLSTLPSGLSIVAGGPARARPRLRCAWPTARKLFPSRSQSSLGKLCDRTLRSLGPRAGPYLQCQKATKAGGHAPSPKGS